MTLSDKIEANLDNIEERARERNLDWVFAIEGGEGTGKSSLALQMAKYMDDDFDVEKQVAFSGEEFRKKASELDNFKPIILDESEGLFASDHMKKENKKTVKFLRKMRELNLFVFICWPVFTEISKKIRKHRVKTVMSCKKQGWAWIYGKSQVSSIQKSRKGKTEYPDKAAAGGWKDPAETIPETWSKYQEMKVDELTDLKEEQVEEKDEDVNWVSTGTFAEMLDVSSDTVRKWTDNGTIKSKRLPSGQRRIPENQKHEVLDT